MKLEIELVPETSWYSNLRNRMSKEDWDKLRKNVYRQYQYHCGVCGAPGKMNCHEIWEYDDALHIQCLKGFIALCELCHHCKHIGFAGYLADKGELDYGALERHFCKVNECTQEQMDEEVRKAFELWDKRSNHMWVTELGEYASLIRS